MTSNNYTTAINSLLKTKHLRQLLTNVLLATSLGFVPYAIADNGLTNTEGTIKFTQEHSLLTQEILQLLDKNHYQHRDLNDQFASDVYAKYLKLLDPQHSYLSEADLIPFGFLTTELDELLAEGDLEAMGQLYSLLQQRRLSFIDYSLAVLAQEEPMFDFGIVEDIRTSPSDEPRLKDLSAIKDLWRRQLKNEFIRGQLDEETPGEIKERLQKRYNLMRRRVSQVKIKDAYQAVSNSITTVTDPHTSYLSPRNLEDFNIDMSLSLEGIGAVLQSKDDYTKVVRLVVGGPAEKAGELKALDYIVGVAQEGEPLQEILGWRLDDVVDQIRGPKGSLVNLQIIPGGDLQQPKKTIQIRRNKVKLEDQAAKKSIIELDTDQGVMKFGVITLPTFYMDFAAAQRGDPNYRSTTRDVFNLINELKEDDVRGIVIDLRNNGGGSLREANQLTGLFIKTGTTVQVRYANGVIEKQIDRNPLLAYKGPLVVLVNRYSASASEIFAAAMQDYKRALIVGSQTYGKGTVQTFGNLSSGQVKFTQAKFYRVSGASTQNKGVMPDIVLPSLDDPSKVGENTQDHALKWDQVSAIDHKTYFPFEKVIPYLQTLQDQRNEENVDWQYITALVEHEKNRPDQVSLNFDQRQKYWQAQKGWYLEHINTLRLGHQLEPVTDAQDHEFDYENSQDDPHVVAGGQVIADLINIVQQADGS